jgi:hypothetical protein
MTNNTLSLLVGYRLWLLPVLLTVGCSVPNASLSPGIDLPGEQGNGDGDAISGGDGDGDAAGGGNNGLGGSCALGGAAGETNSEDLPEGADTRPEDRIAPASGGASSGGAPTQTCILK